MNLIFIIQKINWTTKNNKKGIDENMAKEKYDIHWGKLEIITIKYFFIAILLFLRYNNNLGGYYFSKQKHV